MRIRYSARGLTFSFCANETFKPGTQYRYIIDTKDSSIILIPDPDGKYRMSRKGDEHKPLVDLRNNEVKAAISSAAYLEVGIYCDRIVVSVIRSVNVSSSEPSDEDIVREVDGADKATFVFDKKEFIGHNREIYSALRAAGFMSAKVCDDVSYVYDVVSLFSGAGMLDYPFKCDGSFDIQLAVDFDRAACETYRHMIGGHILHLDMRELNEADVPDCDLVIGGPCCQGFSNANRALTGRDEAGRKRLLIYEYLRIIRAKMPLMFLIENVPQFLTKDGGIYLRSVVDELPEYEVSFSIVTDCEVGGYSTRKRMLLVGSRIGRVDIPNISLYVTKTCRDALKQINPSWVHYEDITESCPNTQRKMSYVQDGENYKAIPELAHLTRHSDVYRRLDPDAPAVTITNWRKVLLMPPEEFLTRDASGRAVQRQLNCAEAKAIQGLPSDYRFFGNLDDIQQQIGNGVTFAIASFAKDVIKNALYAYTNGILCV